MKADKDIVLEIIAGCSNLFDIEHRIIPRLIAALGAVRKEARAAAFKESAEFFCHWLLRAYEAIHRDTSYEEGENLDSVAREINQVIGFAGYEPESTARERLLVKKFSWNALHMEAAANDEEGGGDG